MTDFVVTYVDSADDEWKEGYNAFCRKIGRLQIVEKTRYRSWDTLRYVLRGVNDHMPWINRVHLLVERDSQVPKWVNREAVHVAYHNEVIPKEHLPIYNSTGIELFMYRIPGLAERFIYANDDMIPVGAMREEDFYDENGNPRLKVIEKEYHPGMNLYSHHLHNGETVIREMLGMAYNVKTQMRTGHNLNPMLKSTWERIWKEKGKVLNASVSPFRTDQNINQEIHSYWHILSGNYSPSKRTEKYMEMKDIDFVVDQIEKTDRQMICVNDNGAMNYFSYMMNLKEVFNLKFPKKSKYEL